VYPSSQDEPGQDIPLILTTLVLQILVVVFLYRRKSYVQFPVFFSYCALQVVAGGFLVVARQTSEIVYYYGYWIALGLMLIATFAVWQEILAYSLAGFDPLRERSLLLFRVWAALVLVIAAVMVIRTRGAGFRSEVIANSLLLVQRNLFFVECGLMVLLFVFGKRWGISSRDLVFGIALGCAIIAAVGCFAPLARMLDVQLRLATLRLLLSGGQSLACLVWLPYAMLGGQTFDRRTLSLP
jgi:hypothetical protein